MSNCEATFTALVLDGQGIPSITSPQTIQTALQDAQLPLSNSILLGCHQALLQDVSSLSSKDKASCGFGAGDIVFPAAILELPLRYPTNAVVANIHLCLVQLLRYLAICNNGSNPVHDKASGHEVLGFSSGTLAATVIACAKDIPSCVAHAVSAFRLAFWLGLRSEQYAHTLSSGALKDYPSDATWSLVIFGTTREEIQQAIEQHIVAHVSIQRPSQ